MTRKEAVLKAEEVVRQRFSVAPWLQAVHHAEKDGERWWFETWTRGRHAGEMLCRTTYGSWPDMVAGDRSSWWSVYFSPNEGEFHMECLLVVLDESGEVIQVAEVHNWPS
jgi:hypothetical protein